MASAADHIGQPNPNCVKQVLPVIHNKKCVIAGIVFFAVTALVLGILATIPQLASGMGPLGRFHIPITVALATVALASSIGLAAYTQIIQTDSTLAPEIGGSQTVREETPAEIKHPYSPALIELFGGLENIGLIPLYDISNPDSAKSNFYADVEKFTHHARFKEMPPVIRLRLNCSGGGLQDVIILKYTLFVPEEAGLFGYSLHPDDAALERQYDHVWHDHLILKYQGPDWNVWDPRHPDCLTTDLRKENGYPEFPLPYPPLFSLVADSELNFPKVKKLLRNEPIGLFDGRRSVPSFIKKENDATVPPRGQRMFRDIPAMLGHLSLQDVYPLFNVETFPDFVGRTDGTAVPMNPVGPKKVISF